MKSTIRRSALLGPGILLLGGIIVSCSSDGPTDPGAADVASVVVTPASGTLVSIGETLELSAVARDAAGGTVPGVSITWSSNDEAVAAVSGTGVVTAASDGTATISASVSGVQGTAQITVSQEPASVEAASGDTQVGTVAQPLESDLVVRVIDALGSPVAGVAVAFSVVLGEGSIEPEEGITDGDGEASTSWVLGEISGEQEVLVEVVGPSEIATRLAATGFADDPVQVELLDGDEQFELVETALPAPIRVRLLDQFGNGVPDIEVHFSVSDGASLDEPEVLTDLDGIAEAVWTLGPALGPYAAEAQALDPDSAALGEMVPGSPVAFTAAAVAFEVGSLAATPAAVADTVTIQGMGFHPDPTANMVTVGGEEAQVVGGTQTGLSVVVPSFGCEPAQERTIAVTRGDFSGALEAEVEPEGALRLEVGDRMVLSDPSEYCLQFLAGDSEEYVVGFSSVRPLAGEMVFSLVADDGATPAPAPAPVQAAATMESDPGHHDSPELSLRQWEADFLSGHSGQPRALAMAAPAADSPVAAQYEAGDILSVRVPIITLNPCQDFTQVSPRVLAVGPRAVVATDATIPSDPLIDAAVTAALEEFMDTFGDHIWARLTASFGLPPDLDDDDRILLVFTPAVQPLGVPAFTTVVDQLPSSTCAASDEAFIIYVAIPAEPTLSELESLLTASPPHVAHQLTHVIQFGRRLAAGGGALPTWLGEGQAQAGIEMVGMAIRGDDSGLNYDSGVLNTILGQRWYQPRFDHLSHLFGWDGGSGTVEGAPERCSLFGFGGHLVPCGSEYVGGVSWGFTRYLIDRFAADFPGGEPALLQALMDVEPSQGVVELLESAAGVTFAEIVVEWAMTLYVDGRIPGSAAPPELRFPSWDLEGIYDDLPVERRLNPPLFPFESFGRSGAVVGGGTSYTVISGAGAHGSLALRARDPLDGILGTALDPRLWVVRIR